MRMKNRFRPWLPRLLLAAMVAVTAIVYWPGVAGGWVFDDFPNIVENTAIHITHGHSEPSGWVNAALSSPSSFLRRPLASITFALNWYFSDGNPRSFKLTNILIHLLNGVLLYVMLCELLRLAGICNASRVEARFHENKGGSNSAKWPLPTNDLAGAGLPETESSHPQKESSGKPLAGTDEPAATRLALVVTAAWLLLPINVMAVLYVVQRMESLCQIFILAGLWAYLRGRRIMLTATVRRHERNGFALAVSGIVLGTCLGLTSKETAVLVPVFAFLAEWVVIRFGIQCDWATVPAERDRACKEMPRRTDNRIWTLFTVTLFIPAALGFLWLLRGALEPRAFSGRDFTLVQRLLTEPRVLVDYLHWTLLPNPMVLSLYHDEIVVSTGLLSPWTTLVAIWLLFALITVAICLRKRRPLVSLGILWFFAAQLLTATIVPLELVYEQRMYFASVGVLLAAGALLLGLRWKIAWPFLRGFVVTISLLWFAIATNLRAQEWSDPLRLAVSEANRHPESARAVYEAGRLLLIGSDYRPGKVLDLAWKYLSAAGAIPGSSALADQAMIMIADHNHQGDDASYWNSMIRKLRDQPTRQEDISALISLTD
ncbi:MAG TPA: hypothetical protein VJ719_05040, partial [Chthoniobacterales bacterium]|nr:hypothetical protein [Chthoniobacterales bacterium]